MRENLVRETEGGKGIRDKNERSEGVKHRSSYVRNLDNTTVPFFFTNFPKEVFVSEMYTMFGGFG